MTSNPSQVQDTSPAIEFRDVSLSFDDQPALTDVSFKLNREEMIFVSGRSGSGKSVLLKLAIGLLRPDEGQIFIEGREIDTLDETDLLAIRGGSMGIVFQENALFDSRTVYGNAAYRLEEHGWTEEEIDKAVSEVLRFVGLEGDEDKFPEELSGGMKRRLEIARGLIGWPSIMLFDEPTTMLDPIVAEQVLELVIRARDVNNISSLYVTKKVDDIPYLAKNSAVKDGNGEIIVREASGAELPSTRVIVLQSGKIVFMGGVEEFQTSDLPAIKELRTLDVHDHSHDPYYPDPWDRKRKPKDKVL
jgi:phospholipid/cholesterol/gamma-HCH transport system ATP-binding protein